MRNSNFQPFSFSKVFFDHFISIWLQQNKINYFVPVKAWAVEWETGDNGRGKVTLISGIGAGTLNAQTTVFYLGNFESHGV